MRVMCRLRHLDAQRARCTLRADSASSSRRAAAAPGPAARQPPEAASHRQRVRAAPGARGTMAARRGARAPRAGSGSPLRAGAALPGTSRPPQLARKVQSFNSGPARSAPADRPPRAAPRGGPRVTGGRAIGWRESE